MMKIRIADIINDSIVDGPGIRLTIFTQGCYHNCKGCHNPQTHDINGGRKIEISEIFEKIDKNILLDGITLSGGEPFLQAEAIEEIARETKKRGLNVIAYSGFKFEELIKKEECIRALEQIDYLIDGKFEIDKRSLELKFRGSTNQRIINVQKSLEEGKIKEAKF